MGKTQRQSPSLITVMNDAHNSPELGVTRPLSNSDDSVEVVFSTFEDVEQIKNRMRDVVVEVNSSKDLSRLSSSDSNSPNTDLVVQRLEMSSSLPNLSVIAEKGSEILNKLSQKIISTSAADVRKPVSLAAKEETQPTLCSCGLTSSVNDETQNGCRECICFSAERKCRASDPLDPVPSADCAQHMVTVTSQHTKVHNVYQVSNSNASPVVVSIDANNSKLSTVLEHMPLVYLPKTKQLIQRTENCEKLAIPCNVLQPNSASETLSQVSDELSTESTVVSSSNEDCDKQSELSVVNTSFDSASTILDISISSSTALLDEKEDGKDSVNPDVGDKTDSPVSTLPRTTTGGSLVQTDTSSYSSVSSLSLGNGELSANASISDEYNLEVRNVPSNEVDEGGFMDVNLDGRNSFEKCRNPSQDSGIAVAHDSSGATPKRKTGLSGFFARSLFSRKPKEESPPGWKLFGKVPPKQAPAKNPSQITEEYQCNQRALARKKDIEVTSTTALILENRPSGLPSKSPEEELRHKQQYEAMVEAAKKKELKEAKQKKKQLQQQLRQEQLTTQALRVWTTEILPFWDTASTSKKARELWWMGLPPSVRGKIWQLAIGNELNITSELYEICVSRAEDRIRIMSEGDSDSLCSNEPASSKEASVDLIKLDVSRTFPQLCIFQKGGPYHDLLHSLLGAYACYRPDVGYVQGMSFIAAVLLLNMDVADAFVCFTNLLNKPCQVTFFRMDESIMKAYFATYEEFFAENLPRLFNHFSNQKLTPDLYIIDWMFTLFSKSLPLDVASRVWDVYYRDGEEFLFRTALGILKLHETVLLNMDFIHLAQFLTRLPDNISSVELFRNIKQIVMEVDGRKYSQVLAANRDSQKDS